MRIKHIPGKKGKDIKHTNDQIAEFLFQHLDEYGDEKKDILKCLDYVFNPDRGGDVFLSLHNEEIIGAVVINHTGMEGYIPENILVYIAVNKDHRGKGVGKIIMQNAIENVSGSIALHVEPDNPAIHLYKKLGFTNKYFEMRLKKS
jgi:ribosomal protein S18 acetylase RimI-like enzyme